MNSIAQRHFAAQATVRTTSGATACAGYHAPRHLQTDRLVTCRGVVIGGAIAPPLPATTQDGARLQAALLDGAATRRAQARRPACTADLCQQGRAPCPCPQACHLPDGTHAGTHADVHTHTHRATARAPQRHRADDHGHRWPLAGATPPQPEAFTLGVLGHVLVVAACIAALVLIVITAPSA